jgi:hypothetical protein
MLTQQGRCADARSLSAVEPEWRPRYGHRSDDWMLDPLPVTTRNQRGIIQDVSTRIDGFSRDAECAQTADDLAAIASA